MDILFYLPWCTFKAQFVILPLFLCKTWKKKMLENYYTYNLNSLQQGVKLWQFLVYSEVRKRIMYFFVDSLWKLVAIFSYHNCVKSAQIRRFFWSVFSHIRTEYGEILRTSPYSVRMREIWTRKNSAFGHFSRCAQFKR